MKKYIACLSIFLLFIMAGSAMAVSNIPKPPADVYCLDEAGILSQSTEQAIIATGQNLNAESGAQIVVLTIKTLDGANLEEYALQVFRQWGIGDKTKNNGVLLLIAMNERKTRIEVGYGLEGALPDGKTGRILDENLIPYFAKGQYDAGIINTYNAMLQEVNKEYGINISPISADKAAQPAKKTNNKAGWVQIVGLIFFILIALFLARRGIWWFGGFGGPFGGGGGFGGGGDDFGGGSGGGGGASGDW